MSDGDIREPTGTGFADGASRKRQDNDPKESVCFRPKSSVHFSKSFSWPLRAAMLSRSLGEHAVVRYDRKLNERRTLTLLADREQPTVCQHSTRSPAPAGTYGRPARADAAKCRSD